jgi:4-hydroxybenzoate polyprenyltransferase
VKKLSAYVDLIRLNKPVGIWLFLWPPLCALWLASVGVPSAKILIIFILGVVTMRSAGCVINDWCDRKFDGHVARTKNRPLVTGAVTSKEAWVLFLLLSSIAALLALQLNQLSLEIAFLIFCLTLIYPLMKRWTYLPQFFLGAAVAGAVPIAFAAVQNYLPTELWWVYVMALFWPVIYDTLYAMVDRQDDIKIGVKSTALLLGKWDRLAIAISQMLFLCVLIGLGNAFSLHVPYYFSMGIVALLFFRQSYLIRNRVPEACFKAFSESHWVGLIVFLGIALGM